MAVGHVQQFQILTPQEHLANALKLRAAQLEIDQSTAETAQKLRAEAENAKEQAWLSTAVKTYTHDDGSPDWDTIGNAAMQVSPALGQKVVDWNGKRLSQAAQTRKAEVENEKADFDEDIHKLERITDPSSFALWTPRIKDPHLLQAIGPQFSEQTPTTIRSLVASGLDHTQWLGEQSRIAGKYGKDPEGAFLDDVRVARTDDDLKNAYDALKAHASAETVRRYQQMIGTTLTPEAKQIASERSMTANESADNARAAQGGGGTQTLAEQREQDFLEAEAAKLGKTVAQLTPAERVKIRTAAIKQYGQADDRPAVTVSVGGPSGLNDAALDQAAERYLQTGVLPPMGNGNAGANTRRAILNRAGDLGAGQKIAFNSAEYAANKSTLTTLGKQLDAVTAFEKTGLKNLKMFTDLAAKIPDTGVPWLNIPVRAVASSLAGSENMAAVNAARQVALTEISRVVNNPNLTGVLSDSARQEVANLVPESATFAQIKRVAKVLEQDMSNRHTSLAEQKQDIEHRLGGPEAKPEDAKPKMSAEDLIKKYGGK